MAIKMIKIETQDQIKSIVIGTRIGKAKIVSINQRDSPSLPLRMIEMLFKVTEINNSSITYTNTENEEADNPFQDVAYNTFPVPTTMQKENLISEKWYMQDLIV